MPDPQEIDPRVQSAVDQFQAEALQFSLRFINDAKTRVHYKQLIEAASKEVTGALERGEINAYEAARRAHALRNEVLRFSRTKTSDIGLAFAKDLKAEGRSLAYYVEKYAAELYQKSAQALTNAEREAVYLKVVQRSGVANEEVVALAAGIGKVGRGLLVVSAAVSIWTVYKSDDRLDAIGREGATTGGGILGGMAAGAAVGALGGPAAVVTVPLAAFVGGVLGALGGERLYDRYAHGHW
ncbi:MAG: hypothetical protein U0414_13385 [Polyangiaceae bacterium]